MTDNTDWVAQIKEARKGNGILFASHREMRRLPSYLHEGEQVISLVTGSPKHMIGSESGSVASSKGRGIVVATTERVLFIRDGWVFRNVQDLPYETISSVEFTTGILFGTLSVFGKGDGVFYNWVGRSAGAKFAKIVRQQVSEQNNVSGTTGKKPAVPTGVTAPLGGGGHPAQDRLKDMVASELRQLKALQEEGLITEEEYQIKRAALISKL